MQLIQQEWFRISSQKEVDVKLIEGFLNSIKEHFSNFLLERIVNLQDANVRDKFFVLNNIDFELLGKYCTALLCYQWSLEYC